jgi:anti-sigma factor RsiW
MGCHEFRELVDAHVHGELDLVTTLQFERHLGECADCRALVEEAEQFSRTVQAHMPRFDAPAGLEQKIRSQLGFRERPRLTFFGSALLGWRPFAIAASLIGVLVLEAMSLAVLRPRPAGQLLAEQVVSSHIRSLMANHLSDVVSADQHTVKPWFSGKLDFAPVVTNLAPQGFSLVGGRLDYLGDRAVAALVYKHRQHTINLFLWPSSDSDAKPQILAIRGFNLVHWTRAHMNYWAVSDLNASELSEFARDLKSSSS